MPIIPSLVDQVLTLLNSASAAERATIDVQLHTTYGVPNPSGGSGAQIMTPPAAGEKCPLCGLMFEQQIWNTPPNDTGSTGNVGPKRGR